MFTDRARSMPAMNTDRTMSAEIDGLVPPVQVPPFVSQMGQGILPVPGAAANVVAAETQAPVLAEGNSAPREGTGYRLVLRGLTKSQDKLWIYENFAHFGAIFSVRVSDDGTMGSIVFSDYNSSVVAKEAMQNFTIGENLLRITTEEVIPSTGRPRDSTTEQPDATLLSPSVFSDEMIGQALGSLPQ